MRYTVPAVDLTYANGNLSIPVIQEWIEVSLGIETAEDLGFGPDRRNSKIFKFNYFNKERPGYDAEIVHLMQIGEALKECRSFSYLLAKKPEGYVSL